MFRALFEKMTNGMLWFIVIPTAALFLSLAALAGSYARIAWDANNINLNAGRVEVASNIRNIDQGIQSLSNFINQQQNNNNKQMEMVSAKLTLTKNSHPTIAPQTTAQAVAGLNEAIIRIKNQSNQLAEQQRNIQAVKDELNQLKQELQKKA